MARRFWGWLVVMLALVACNLTEPPPTESTPTPAAPLPPVQTAWGEAAALAQSPSISPPALIEPGERTGAYRTGDDQLLSDAQGQSRISAEDFAIAVLDEVEHGQFVRRRFTVAH